MKKRYLIISLVTLILLLSCATKKNVYMSRPAPLLDRKINVALYSFVFPKSMTNKSDKVKYLNTDIYADYVLGSFISNFNAKSEMISISTIESIITSKEFEKFNYQSILGSDKVAGDGTFATNYIPDDIYSLLQDKVDAIMTVESSMSFWSQKAVISFIMRDVKTKKIIWKDSAEGYSYHIIGDIAPTRKSFNQFALLDAMDAQKKHQKELYTIIDGAIDDSIVSLQNKSPYMFSTNYILFTQKTFSLTNENYAKRAGI